MTLDLVLAVGGGTLLVLGLVSRWAKRVALSPVLLAMLVGIVLGPQVLGIPGPSHPFEHAYVLRDTARVAVALSAAEIGLRIHRDEISNNLRRVGALLAVGMPVMWLVTSAGAWLLLGLPAATALLLGATLTPTDPAVASTLVSGALPERMLPRRLRMTMQMESGVNDGLALPLVLVSVSVVVSGLDGLASGVWQSLREVGVAVLLGPLLGVLVGRATHTARERQAYEESFRPLVAPMLALFTLGLAGLLGASGPLACFGAGVALSFTVPAELREPLVFAVESVTKIAVIPAFVMFGLLIPWSDWWSLGLPGIGFALWTLFLRRPVAGVLALAPLRTGRHSTAFLSWFGPLGLAALFYLGYLQEYDLTHYDRLLAAGTLTVFVSIVAQALTANPAVSAYARTTGSALPEDAPEEQEATLAGRLP